MAFKNIVWEISTFEFTLDYKGVTHNWWRYSDIN